MACWLVKTEPNTYSIKDLQKERVTAWDGVRNYQARNFLKTMETGDQVLIYHSVEEPLGIAGLAKVKKRAYPDPTQFDKKSRYYDESASKEDPRWFCPDLEFVRTFTRLITLKELKSIKGLEKMELLRKGSRLSVQPVTEREMETILALSESNK